MRPRRRLGLVCSPPAIVVLASLTSGLACLGPTTPGTGPSDSIAAPISELVGRTYLGYPGGLYPDADDPPPAHAAEGAARAKLIAPRDTGGTADAGGTFVLLSIGTTNAAQEFCSTSGYAPCNPWSFAGQAANDPSVNHTTLAIVNGAGPGQYASAWESPGAASYDRVRDSSLAPLGLSERQVELVWLNVYDNAPTRSLPANDADAFVLERRMGNVVRALKARYANLTMVFISSRIWGGFATTNTNPEPYAYESGFAVKWLAQAQIAQMASGTAQDTLAGDLSYTSVAPWIGWGPYLWAAGEQARSDGLQWLRQDFLPSDGTRPSSSGEQKVGDLLLRFFKENTLSRCWFVPGETCRA